MAGCLTAWKTLQVLKSYLLPWQRERNKREGGEELCQDMRVLRLQGRRLGDGKNDLGQGTPGFGSTS